MPGRVAAQSILEVGTFVFEALWRNIPIILRCIPVRPSPGTRTCSASLHLTRKRTRGREDCQLCQLHAGGTKTAPTLSLRTPVRSGAVVVAAAVVVLSGVVVVVAVVVAAAVVVVVVVVAATTSTTAATTIVAAVVVVVVLVAAAVAVATVVVVVAVVVVVDCHHYSPSSV